MANMRRMKIFSGTAHPSLANDIARACGVELAQGEIIRFSDGEMTARIDESVRGADVFVIQPTCAPAETLIELLIFIDALRRASAKSITAVIPYFGYARQDRKTRARDPITAKLVANLLTQAGAHRVLTMDLHANQIQGFFDIPVDHLLAVPLLANYLLNKVLDDPVVVAPDHGGIIRARDLAVRLKAPLAIIDKRRPQHNVMEVMNIIGDIKGKTAIMVDDIIDTAGTIVNGARALQDLGAARVYACCVHPVLSGPAIKRIEGSVLEELIVADTIPLGDKAIDKIKTISVAQLFASAIVNIYEQASVSQLFN